MCNVLLFSFCAPPPSPTARIAHVPPTHIPLTHPPVPQNAIKVVLLYELRQLVDDECQS